MMRPVELVHRAVTVVLLAGVLVSGIGAAPSGAATRTVTFSARVVSYDLAVGPNQRVLVGLLAGDAGLVGFGTVRFDFAYLGTKREPIRPQAGPSVTAAYKLVAGFTAKNPPPDPRIFKPSQATGVYAAEGLTFDRAGRWRVLVSVRFGDQTARVPAKFTVQAAHRVVAAGDQAPRSEHPLAGAAGIDARSIDSRASATTPIPDPELHAITVAQALAAGKPTVVVVSTPTFCVSRFCGPITDSVRLLASRYADRVAFVHLEVWNNFEKQQLNEAAAQWILPRTGKGHANEPWVFTVSTDGIIRQRLDNVASDQDLEAATAALVS